MRKVLVGGALGCALAAAGLVMTPLRYHLIPPKLTSGQRAILDRAQAGLSVYATNSQTARGFFRDANRYARWAVFIPGVGDFDVDSNRARPLAVAVHPHDVATTIASYDHRADRILFIEPKCSLMSHLTLGLVYAHELQHRRDFKGRVFSAGDSVRSRPRIMTELNARQSVISILSEFTASRWDSVVILHNATYNRYSLAQKKKHPYGKIALETDRRWLAQEFGRLGPADRDYLNSMLQFDAALRAALPDTAVTPADSLERLLMVIRKF